MTYHTRVARCNQLADWAKVIVANHGADADRIANAHQALIFTQGALELLQDCGALNIRPDEDRLVDRLLNKAEESLSRDRRREIIGKLDALNADPIVAAFVGRLVAYRAADDMACVALLIEICGLYRDALQLESLIGTSDPYGDELDSSPFADADEAERDRRLKMMLDDFGS